MHGKIKTFITSRPLNVIFWKTWATVLNKRIPESQQWLSYTENKIGLEIGGPSAVFKNYLPVYANLRRLDEVNFSENTLWTSSSDKAVPDTTGDRFITDGTDLTLIPDESYEVILNCNTLEHIANPIKALFEWKRVLKINGVMICVLPRKESNFDHKRMITSERHLIEDYENHVDEGDLTHLSEILHLHDLKRDPLAGSFENFKKRSEMNLKFRALHHHVFDIPLLKALMKFIDMKPVLWHSSPTDHFILSVKDHPSNL